VCPSRHFPAAAVYKYGMAGGMAVTGSTRLGMELQCIRGDTTAMHARACALLWWWMVFLQIGGVPALVVDVEAHQLALAPRRTRHPR
jgi:hypothetical protein